MNDSYKLLYSQKARKKLPLVTFLFLVGVFFIATHNLSMSRSEGFTVPSDSMEKATAEGSLRRQIAFLSLGLFGIISLIRQGRSRLKIRGLLGWLIVFYLFWSFISIVWAVNTALTFRRLILFAMLCLAATAASQIFSLRNILSFTLLATGLYLLIGIFTEIALGTFHPFTPGYRFAGTLHPNEQGINCALLLLSSFGFYQTDKRDRKLFLVCMIIGFIFLFLTKSRTASASAIFALFVYWGLVSSTSRKFVLFFGLCFTFCLLLLLVGDEFLSGIRQGILLGREDLTVYTLTGRIPLWKQCLEYVTKRPFIGFGYNSFWSPYHIGEVSYVQGWGVRSAHSIYLELILNTGYVGMITFVAIFSLGITVSVKYLKVYKNIVYAFFCSFLVYFMVQGILETSIINPLFAMFLSMMVLARLGFRDTHK